MLIMKKLLIIFTLFLILSSTLPASSFAQLRTNSNTVETRVGNPIQTSSSPIAQVAISLINNVGGACSGYLRGSNVGSCLSGVSLPDVPFSSVAITQLVASTNNNGCDLGTCLQCVGFVQSAVGGAFGQPLNNGGNAKDYATSVPTGYQYIPLSTGTPMREGDIIIKTEGQWGHIAVVTAVYDESTFQVAEANYNLGGELRLNNTVTSIWSGFLRKI